MSIRPQRPEGLVRERARGGRGVPRRPCLQLRVPADGGGEPGLALPGGSERAGAP
jgi:hypothetical protein